MKRNIASAVLTALVFALALPQALDAAEGNVKKEMSEMLPGEYKAFVRLNPKRVSEIWLTISAVNDGVVSGSLSIFRKSCESRGTVSGVVQDGVLQLFWDKEGVCGGPRKYVLTMEDEKTLVGKMGSFPVTFRRK